MLTDREDELRYLRLVLHTLGPLREAGLTHAQLEQLWDLASRSLAARTGREPG